jgi:asparaginyl-tRNA synthetase
MKQVRIGSIHEKMVGNSIKLCGWVRTVRTQKNFSFVEINDGSNLAGFQIVLESSLPDYDKILGQLTTGTSVVAQGTVVESPGGKQKWELKASSVHIIGECPVADYPLQKKRHSLEFLRTIAHLRPRTNTQGAVLRVRNCLAFATHQFFQKEGFLYVQTPIITASDCEGGGQQFNVTSLPLSNLPKLKDGGVDYGQDFFHKPTYLTVSGQLEGEALACALSNIYTFGPTFRAENSNTSRHLAEFWMIEPEMAFADLKDNMDLAERYLKFIIQAALDQCFADLEFFDEFYEKGLIHRLQHMLSSEFAHLTYTEAVQILEKSGQPFDFPVKWGIDLQSEHERYLAEHYLKKPLILTDYPAKIKAFYMRLNSDEKTVAAMDVLAPKIGEIIGGSQREERFDLLKAKILQQGLPLEDYDWYLQLRKYGTVPHAGFGAGFERLIQFVTGIENIRDVIPFPRYPGHAEF